MKLVLFLLLFLSIFRANACALSTYYWPIPSGYIEGAIDFTSIVKRQVSWNAKSATAFDISPPMKNVRTNIEKIINHYKYINSLPELVDELQLKDFELISYRVEPVVGNSFMNSEGRLEGSLGYLLPEINFEELQEKWLIVLEYKLVFSWPNDKLYLLHKIEIPTLPDGTILYEYPGMGRCEP